MFKTLFIGFQYSVPQHLLSRLVGRLARSQKTWLAQPFIRLFVRRFGVDLSEAEMSEPSDYACFNDFFTRALKPGARPWSATHALPQDTLVSPVDGAVSQAGLINQGTLVQAKGQQYTVARLLGQIEASTAYDNGAFATLYLSPRDYHRIHMPCSGQLLRMTYVPGQLFSVNTVTAQRVPELFARNERLVCEFDTPAGPMTMVWVGAMIVASISTAWAGLVAPAQGRRELTHWDYSNQPIALARGDEVGRFLLGSTVILLTAQPGAWTDQLAPGQPIHCAQALGSMALKASQSTEQD
jgi:phosphatidylserine decarboxylase